MITKELFAKVFPEEFIERHVQAGERVDGRQSQDSRRITIEKSSLTIIRE